MDLREKFFDTAMIGGSAAKDILRADSLETMKSQIPNKPDLSVRLTPNCPVGRKRVILSDDYFPAMNLPHVSSRRGQSSD